jgi:Flp pilus assembly protein TadB
MLSDAEQRRLTEIESQLRSDDPAFVQRFDDGGKRRSPQRGRGVAALLGVSVAVTAAVLVLALVLVLVLVLDNAGPAVAAVTVIAVIGTALWISHPRRT